MATVRDVFEITMALLDELDGADGQAVRTENNDYMMRTPYIIAQLCGELFVHSDGFLDGADGKRPAFPSVAELDDVIGLDEFLCRSVMPCGLASRLVIDENPAVAGYYEQKYQQLLARYGSARPGTFEPIADVYGGDAFYAAGGGE